jgi:hypothetical protein
MHLTEHAAAGAPDAEIEVTPSMIASGVEFLRESGLSDLEVDLVTPALVKGLIGAVFSEHDCSFGLP